jgi:hypothetical protein
MSKRIGPFVASVSLLIALLAYWPSAAAFTPAILLSFLAGIGAVAGLVLGAVRMSTLTLLIVLLTALVSPLISDIAGGARGAYLVLGVAPVAVVLFAALLFWDFRRRGASQAVAADGEG